MNRIKLSIRVPAGQETMIRHIAKVRGMTRYQALLRVSKQPKPSRMLYCNRNTAGIPASAKPPRRC